MSERVFVTDSSSPALPKLRPQPAKAQPATLTLPRHVAPAARAVVGDVEPQADAVCSRAALVSRLARRDDLDDKDGEDRLAEQDTRPMSYRRGPAKPKPEKTPRREPKSTPEIRRKAAPWDEPEDSSPVAPEAATNAPPRLPAKRKPGRTKPSRPAPRVSIKPRSRKDKQ